MKSAPTIKAFAVVVILTLGLGLLWAKYSDFLSSGQKPPDNALKLNQLVEKGVPEFTVTTLDGKTLSLKAFAGKILILNFWASWCDPCIAEFPSLMNLIDKFKGRVVLLAVSADHELADIHNFLKIFKVNSPHVFISWDKDYKLAEQFGTTRLPESYIIGADGRFIRKVAGVDDWSTQEAYEYFQFLLGEKK